MPIFLLGPSDGGTLFLFLTSLQNFFPPSTVDIGRRHAADACVVALMTVKLDELRHRLSKLLGAGLSQQVHPRLQHLMKAFGRVRGKPLTLSRLSMPVCHSLKFAALNVLRRV